MLIACFASGSIWENSTAWMPRDSPSPWNLFLTELALRLPSAAAAKPTLNCFLRYLKETGVIPATELAVPVNPRAELVEAYCTSLRNLRALQERTVRRIRSTCRRFMAFFAGESEVTLRSLQPEVIHRFLISRGHGTHRSDLNSSLPDDHGGLVTGGQCPLPPKLWPPLRSGKTSMTDSGYLAPFIRSFFEDHLVCRRNVSRNTIQSYRDAVKLLLAFAAEQRKRPATKLLIGDINEEIVVGFLTHLEQTRTNSIQTRNHRLVAVRRLFDYIAARDPRLLDQCHRIATIPRKRGAVLPEIHYLEKEQLTALLGAIPKDSALGRRDYTLLLFMYNTGARVQEVADTRVSWLTLTRRSKSNCSEKAANGGRARCGKAPYSIFASSSSNESAAPAQTTISSSIATAAP